MKYFILTIAIALSSGCQSTEESYVLAGPPFSLCSSLLSGHGAKRNRGADFNTLEWKSKDRDVFIYIGANPDFSEDVKDLKSIGNLSKFVKINKISINNRAENLYGFPTIHGLTGYAHVLVAGNSNESVQFSKEIGDSLHICRNLQ